MLSLWLDTLVSMFCNFIGWCAWASTNWLWHIEEQACEPSSLTIIYTCTFKLQVDHRKSDQLRYRFNDVMLLLFHWSFRVVVQVLSTCIGCNPQSDLQITCTYTYVPGSHEGSPTSWMSARPWQLRHRCENHKWSLGRQRGTTGPTTSSTCTSGSLICFDRWESRGLFSTRGSSEVVYLLRAEITCTWISNNIKYSMAGMVKFRQWTVT